jgi:tetratricopeptide (TPR) repeat protein/TolB-like protein
MADPQDTRPPERHDKDGRPEAREPRSSSADSATLSTGGLRPVEEGDEQAGLQVERLAVVAGPPTFSDGQIVAERYQVLRFIARGGMGEVYEVMDQALGDRVAMKTIRPDLAEDPRALERFKREIRMARQISHPNVCRIHEFWTHKAGGEAGGEDVFFLTMELLRGETLSERISRGRVLSDEALPIIVQVALALDAAHVRGIIHRDLKSSNVMLEPSGSPGIPPRAVITDFGLARGFNPDVSVASISDSGAVIGTLAYMAPEQVEGLPLTPAADLYALGVVMYEMLTGQRPFRGNTPVSMAVKRLTDPPPPPRVHVPDLNPVWEGVILGCLEREPSARYPTGRAIVQALAALGPIPDFVGTVSSSAVTAGPLQRKPKDGDPTVRTMRMEAAAKAPKQRPWRDRRIQVAALAVLLAGVGGLASWRFLGGRVTAPPQSSGAPAARAVTARRALAVIGLKNATGRPDVAWLGTAIGEMLLSDLTSGGGLRPIPGEEVSRARREQGLGEPDTLAKETAVRLHRSLGADYVVVGSYTVIGESGSRMVRIDVRLQDAASGEVLASAPATGAEGELFDVVTRAGAPLRERLGIPRVSAALEARVRTSLPKKPEAARLYSEGLASLRLSDALSARKALDAAIAVEADHPLPHAALAEAWAMLGYRTRALSAIEKASSLSTSLSDEQKLSIDARRLELSRKWNEAVEVYRSVLALHPDDLDSALRMIDTLIEVSRGREAMEAVETLRKLPEPLSLDTRIDLAEARASLELGDLKRVQAAAARAAEKAQASGARLLLARARLREAAALAQLGSGPQALAAAEEAQGLFEAAGDRASVALSLEHQALMIHRQGDVDGALRLYRKALAIRRELGDENGVARASYNIARGLFAQGKSAEAQRMFADCLATFQRIGADSEAANAVSALGVQLEAAGDLAGAEQRYREALAMFSRIGDKPGLATVLGNVGDVLAARGDLTGAQEMHSEALAMNREIGDKTGIGYDLKRLGDILTAKGDLRVAKERYEQALTTQAQMGDRLSAAETRLGLATLARAEGRASDAEALAREAEEVLRAEGATDTAALAQLLLAETLADQGKVGDAAAAVEKARAVATETGAQELAFRLAVVDSRLKARMGKSAEAAAGLKVLADAVAAGRKSGRGAQVFEARLALHQLQLAVGQGSQARTGLAALAKDANAAGFSLIARQADAAVKGGGEVAAAPK